MLFVSKYRMIKDEELVDVLYQPKVSTFDNLFKKVLADKTLASEFNEILSIIGYNPAIMSAMSRILSDANSNQATRLLNLLTIDNLSLFINTGMNSTKYSKAITDVVTFHKLGYREFTQLFSKEVRQNFQFFVYFSLQNDTGLSEEDYINLIYVDIYNTLQNLNVKHTLNATTYFYINPKTLVRNTFYKNRILTILERLGKQFQQENLFLKIEYNIYTTKNIDNFNYAYKIYDFEYDYLEAISDVLWTLSKDYSNLVYRSPVSRFIKNRLVFSKNLSDKLKGSDLEKTLNTLFYPIHNQLSKSMNSTTKIIAKKAYNKKEIVEIVGENSLSESELKELFYPNLPQQTTKEILSNNSKDILIKNIIENLPVNAYKSEVLRQETQKLLLENKVMPKFVATNYVRLHIFSETDNNILFGGHFSLAQIIETLDNITSLTPMHLKFIQELLDSDLYQQILLGLDTNTIFRLFSNHKYTNETQDYLIYTDNVRVTPEIAKQIGFHFISTNY